MRKPPRKGHPVRFTSSDGVRPVHSQDPVVGLRFTIEARYGGSVQVDLTDISQRALAIAFAGALRRHAGIGGPLGSAKVIQQHLRGYRQFFLYLRQHAPTVTRPNDLIKEHIDGFEAALQAKDLQPMYRLMLLGKIINALRSINSDRPKLLSEELCRRLSYTSRFSVGPPHPRDAYSPFIARQLRDAARTDIDQLFRRFGSQPDDHGDEHIRRAIARVEAEIAKNGFIESPHPAFNALYCIRKRRRLAVSTLSDDVHGRHHLLSTDLPPLLTLLSLETGLEIECCKALTIDCLKNPSPGTVELMYCKRRARGAEHKFIRIRDGSIRTPGGLIRKLIEVTAPARQHLKTDRLWVHLGMRGLFSRIGQLGATLDSWTARHGIVDDDGRPFRLVLARLRKTHKALWYLKTEGHMARFAVGHTPEIAARHYADLPSLRPLHEATVAAAFEEAVTATGPTVLSPDKEAAWRSPSDNRPGDKPPPNAIKLLDGKQDVWLASCAGFHNSPFSPPGSPCSHPFWGCLDCRNAVITARKLPAIIAFLAFIEEERAGLSAGDWNTKFGRAHARITQQILPTFSDSVIAEARLAITAHTLYLPPEVRS